MSSVEKKPTVIGGKLKLKGFGKDLVGIKRKVSPDPSEIKQLTTNTNTEATIPPPTTIANDAHLTEAQKRFKQRRLEHEKQEVKKLASVGFRGRIEQYNQKLSKLTEHNDVPKVSAAGNG